MKDIKKKAREIGVKTTKMKKIDLIHAIQRAEGYSECFKTKDVCDQVECCWRSACIK
jgi:hypothetical protein